MTATTSPDPSLSGYTNLSARDLVTWGYVVFASRYVASGLRDLWRGSDMSMSHLANFGVFQLLAWAAAFILLQRSEKLMHASRRDIVVIAASLLTVLLPSDNASWIGMTAFAGYILFAFYGDQNFRAAAIVIIALATQLFWGRILFNIIAFKIEVIDASLATGLLSLLHYTVSQQSNILTTGTHQIAIYDSCTSFHNISIAMLCWVSVTKLARTNWVSADAWTMILLVVTTVAMNSVRLFLMASSAPDAFDYWHIGPGAGMINASATLLVVAISLVGAFPKRLNR